MTLSDDTRLLRSVAARIVGPDAADDIVQETFLRALASPPADTATSITPWLVTVARHAAIDFLRTHGRFDPLDVDEIPEPEADPVGGSLPAILAGLGRLTEGEVVVLLLRDGLDLSVDEVAEVVGTTVGTVRVQHLRARRKAANAAGPDVDGLVALDRFLCWLMAREIAGLPVRRGNPDGRPDPAFSAGVMEAQAMLLDAMVEVARSAGRPDLEARALLSRGTVRALVAPEAALDDLRRVVALDGEVTVALSRMTSVLYQGGRRAEARLAAEAGLARGDQPHLRPVLHQFLAAICVDEGDPPGARLQAAAAREGGGTQATIANAAALALLAEDRWEEARVELMIALSAVRACGNLHDETAVLSNLSLASMGVGDLDGATRCCNDALRLARQRGDRPREATITGNLALIARLEGRLDDAALGFERTIELCRSTGRTAGEDMARMNLAIVDHLRGRLDACATQLRECVRRFEAAGVGAQIPFARAHLAAVEAELQRGSPGAFDEVRALARSAGQRCLPMAVDLLESLADIHTDAGAERARALLAASVDTSTDVRTAVQVVRSALDRR